MSRVVAATVRSHDTATGAGSALLDDGSPITYSPSAFAVSRLRLLRTGQRIDVHLDEAGAVVAVGLPGDRA